MNYKIILSTVFLLVFTPSYAAESFPEHGEANFIVCNASPEPISIGIVDISYYDYADTSRHGQPMIIKALEIPAESSVRRLIKTLEEISSGYQVWVYGKHVCKKYAVANYNPAMSAVFLWDGAALVSNGSGISVTQEEDCFDK